MLNLKTRFSSISDRLIRISRKTDIGFGIPTPNNLHENYFWKIRCSLVTGRPMEFRGEWTMDSNSRSRIAFGEAQSALRFWLSCDVFRPISKIRTDKQAENYFYCALLYKKENYCKYWKTWQYWTLKWFAWVWGWVGENARVRVKIKVKLKTRVQIWVRVWIILRYETSVFRLVRRADQSGVMWGRMKLFLSAYFAVS